MHNKFEDTNFNVVGIPYDDEVNILSPYITKGRKRSILCSSFKGKKRKERERDSELDFTVLPFFFFFLSTRSILGF